MWICFLLGFAFCFLGMVCKKTCALYVDQTDKQERSLSHNVFLEIKLKKKLIYLLYKDWIVFLL